VAAELRYGCARKAAPHLKRRVAACLAEVPALPFDVPAGGAYGATRADLAAAERPIGSNDLLIAAHACALAATMVTANVGEFRPVHGLNVEHRLEQERPATHHIAWRPAVP
jgi:tRNA(fMet)-specific endonuclease VapC